MVVRDPACAVAVASMAALTLASISGMGGASYEQAAKARAVSNKVSAARRPGRQARAASRKTLVGTGASYYRSAGG